MTVQAQVAARLAGWRQLNRQGLVRLVLLDIDGCLTGGEVTPLSFPVLRRLQRYNRETATDSAVPSITLCTGRPEPYVELMTQAIGGFLPAVWENGAGLYQPDGYRFLLHPLIDAVRLAAFAVARRLVDKFLIGPGLARAQPGKEVSITLYACAETTLDQVFEVAYRVLRGLKGLYWVQRSLTTVEVLPAGIHKGVGVRWLLELLEIKAELALGVGDSPADSQIFRETGLGATPANGAPELRQAADYVATRRDGQGVLEIVDWCIARNRATLSAAGPHTFVLI